MNFEDPFDTTARHSLRASDLDRETAADRLRRVHGEGRLSDDELEQRLGEAYRARSYGDLERLFADLPGDRHPAMRGWGLSVGRSGRPPWFVIVAGLLVVWATLGALLSPFHGPYDHPHPPLLLIALVAFLIWRGVTHRRRARG